MNQLIKRILTIVSAMILCVAAVNAQSSGDKLYNQGLALQKTMTIDAQNKAIAKFQSAKKLYDSAAKKSQCDAAINVSRGIISSLKGSGGSGNGKGSKSSKGNAGSKNSEKTRDSAPAATLKLSNQRFHLNEDYGYADVTVTTNQSGWSVAPVANYDGSTFVRVEKTGANTFRVTVPENTSTEPRVQYVQVSAGTATARFEVSQAGREITLSTSANTISCGKKGGDKKIEIFSNSEAEYVDNYNENWHVIECPQWITVVPEVKKYKGKAEKIVDQGIGAVANVFKGKKRGEKDPGAVKSSAKIIFDKMPSGEVTRKGEIVFESGYKQHRVVVTQN